MLPFRHWSAVLLVLIVLLGFCLTANGQITSKAPFSAADDPGFQRDQGVEISTIGSLVRDFRVVPAAANESAEKQDQVEEPSHSGMPKPESDDKITELKNRIIELQNKSKLGFKKVAVCNKVEGYGMYSPIEPGKLTRSFILYFEPANVSTLVTPGRYVVDCTVDILQVSRDASGKFIGRRMKKLKINKVSRSPVLDLYFALNMTMKKPPKEDLVIKTILFDNIKNQSTTVNYRINVKPKGKKGVNGV